MITAKKHIKHKYVWARFAFEIVGYTLPRKCFEFLKTYLHRIKQTRKKKRKRHVNISQEPGDISIFFCVIQIRFLPLLIFVVLKCTRIRSSPGAASVELRDVLISQK